MTEPVEPSCDRSIAGSGSLDYLFRRFLHNFLDERPHSSKNNPAWFSANRTHVDLSCRPATTAFEIAEMALQGFGHSQA